MRLLIDTHIFLWALDTPERLGATVEAAIVAPTSEIFVSAATAWELTIKRAVGRLTFPLERFDQILVDLGFTALAITAAHAIAAGSLARLHSDPFDRMLIAQAQLENLVLVTEDRTIRRYPVAVLGA